MRESSGVRIIRRGGYHWPALFAQLTEVQKPRLYFRGFGLGGSSSINASGAVRGTPDDYDGWAREGCDGWAWKDVLPSLIRLENDLDGSCCKGIQGGDFCGGRALAGRYQRPWR